MLDWLLGSSPKQRGVVSDEGWWPLSSGLFGLPRSWNNSNTTAGVKVSEDSALTYNAVWCATRIICETAAMLPLSPYRRLADGGREEATDHPSYQLLKSLPNPTMTAMPFREGRTIHQVNWGNGFAEIEWKDGKRNEIEALWPIHPSRVSPTKPGDKDNEGNELLPEFPYLIKNNDGTSVALRADEILHYPGCLSEDGIWGKGVIAYARESIGAALAVEKHGGTYFGAGGIPRVVVFLPGLRDSEQRKSFRKEWKEIHGKPGGGDVGILPTEGRLDKLDFSNEDGQFMETSKAKKEDVGTWYRLPPHMMGILDRAASGRSIEQLALEFVNYSLMPWLVRQEQQNNLKLLKESDRKDYYFKHNVDALLRGDFETRMKGYQTQLMYGIRNINEIREKEDANPIGKYGKVHFFPVNMTTVDKVIEAPLPPQMPSGPGASPQEQPAKSPQPNNNKEALDAARLVLEDAIARMLAVEAREVKKFADKPDFEERLAEFHGGHRTRMNAAFEPAAKMLAALGKDIHQAEAAARIEQHSFSFLLESYAADTKTQFAARLERWSERAGKLAAEIMGA